MTTNEEYSRSNENLRLPIQMQLSEKLKPLSQIFIAFLKKTFNFKHFEKKSSIAQLYLKLFNLKDVLT